jgi:hypothetical protein
MGARKGGSVELVKSGCVEWSTAVDVGRELYHLPGVNGNSRAQSAARSPRPRAVDMSVGFTVPRLFLGSASSQGEPLFAMPDILSNDSRHRAAKVYRFGANPGVDRKGAGPSGEARPALRSWHLGRRSGRTSALPYPPSK